MTGIRRSSCLTKTSRGGNAIGSAAKRTEPDYNEGNPRVERNLENLARLPMGPIMRVPALAQAALSNQSERPPAGQSQAMKMPIAAGQPPPLPRLGKSL